MIAGGRRYVEYKSRSDVFTLWCLSDLHWGSRNCAADRVREDLAAIADDPYALWIGVGDYADYIGFRDKRFDPDVAPADMKVRDLGRLGRLLTGQVRDLFMPIADKCVGLLSGNHEKAYERHNDQAGLHSWLCTELAVPDLGYCCFVDLTFIRKPRSSRPNVVLSDAKGKMGGDSRWRRRIFAHHGAGFAQTPGGKLNRLIQFMDYFESDLTLCAHVHDVVAKRLTRLGVDDKCGHIIDREQLGIVTGTYLLTYHEGPAGYGEQKGYRPSPLGAARVTLCPDHQTMYATI